MLDMDGKEIDLCSRPPSGPYPSFSPRPSPVFILKSQTRFFLIFDCLKIIWAADGMIAYQKKTERQFRFRLQIKRYSECLLLLEKYIEFYGYF